MKTAEFTGYINLQGVHIEDGLKHRPIAFQDVGEHIILRWIKAGEGDDWSTRRYYEHEVKLTRQQAMEEPMDIMRTGILCLEELERWRENEKND